MSQDQFLFGVFVIFFYLVMFIRLLVVNSKYGRSALAQVIGVLVLLGTLWFIAPQWVGLSGVAAYLILFAVPSILILKIARAVSDRRFDDAHRLAKIYCRFPLASKKIVRPDTYLALQFAKEGQKEKAIALLRGLIDKPNGFSEKVYLFQFEDKSWSETLEMLNEELRLSPGDVSIQLLRMICLGHLGKYSELVRVYQQNEHSFRRHGLITQAWMNLFTFTGRAEELSKLFKTSSVPFKNLRQGFAEMIAGNLEVATELLKSVADQTEDFDLAYIAKEKLKQPLATVGESLSSEEKEIIESAIVAQEIVNRRRSGILNRDMWKSAVFWIIIANVIAYLYEVYTGATESSEALYNIGAPTSWNIKHGEWWRFFVGTFLHIGVTHLSMNMFALLLLGKAIESRLGTIKFTLMYLAAGTLAVFSAAWLLSRSSDEAQFLIGASGGVMALIGAELAILLRSTKFQKFQSLKREIRNCLFVILLQAGIDFIIPGISMTAHLAGAIFGFLITLSFYRPSSARG